MSVIVGAPAALILQSELYSTVNLNPNELRCTAMFSFYSLRPPFPPPIPLLKRDPSSFSVLGLTDVTGALSESDARGGDDS